jgi:hypothetical protein
LAAIDAALEKIAKAVAAIRDADRAILESRPGKDIRTWFSFGHVAERLQRRLGDIGIAPDLRDDKGKPSPLLVELAGAHSSISDHLK